MASRNGRYTSRRAVNGALGTFVEGGSLDDGQQMLGGPSVLRSAATKQVNGVTISVQPLRETSIAEITDMLPRRPDATLPRVRIAWSESNRPLSDVAVNPPVSPPNRPPARGTRQHSGRLVPHSDARIGPVSCPSRMKTNIGLNEEDRLEVGAMLNLLLADEYVIYATARDYHWNVTGPEFISLHQQFEAQFTQTAEWIDQVAERARAIGAGARGNWADLTKAARLSADPGIDLSAEHMLAELLALHEETIVQLRTDSDACIDRYNDAGTADFLTGLMEQHEKVGWMLRAQLETEEEESSQDAPAGIAHS